jgi:DNA-binding IclR family transcriptional regulator
MSDGSGEAEGRRRPLDVTEADEDVPVRSVARALDILFALEHGRQTAGMIARSTGLSKVTARRLLGSLTYRGLVVADPTTSTYMLGPGCFGILDAVVRGAGGMEVIAGSVLTELAAATRETVAVYVRAGPRRICVAQVPSPQPVRYTARLGMENPIHTGAMGKVLLAFSEPDEREDIVSRMTLDASTDATITDRDVLDAELRKIREQGYAVSRGERSPGVAAISAPVFAGDGRILAALSILGPDERLTDAVMADVRPRLLAAATQVADRVAAQGGAPIDEPQLAEVP